MPSIDENRGWAAYHWRDGGEEWSSAWGSSAHLWHVTILPRIFPYVSSEHVLEIAPGHGRCTEYLRRYARRLTVVDLVPECIEACRTRFADARNIEYHANDGRTLPMVETGRVDFVFSWDSLVHAEDDVMSAYASEVARVLRPGGFAFLHHSNLGANPHVERDHWRARSMSGEKMAAFAERAQLQCVTQELVPWGGDAAIDCWSLLRKPHAGEPARAVSPRVVPLQLADETQTAIRLRALYPSPSDDAWDRRDLPVSVASAALTTTAPVLLRYRLVDVLNDGLKRVPFVHAALRRAARALVARSGAGGRG